MKHDIKINSGHMTEAIDRTYLILDIFNEHVSNHLFIEQNKRLSDMAEKISTDMYKFYCAVAEECDNHESRS